MLALVDTHCHLDAAEFDADRDAVVAEARVAGTACIVVPAVAQNRFEAIAALCQRYPGCAPAYGIHPLAVSQATPGDLEVLKRCLATHPPVAVGEIGLDYYVPGTDIAMQQEYFVAQLKLARDFDLPVILHVRRAVDAVLSALRRTGAVGGIAHAFNGSLQQAQVFLRMGFKLGLGGAMTWPRALHIRALAAALPLEGIVLETDAPDMPPAWLGGKGRNTPSQLRRIAETLAELRGINLSCLAEKTRQNAISALPGLARYTHDMKFHMNFGEKPQRIQ